MSTPAQPELPDNWGRWGPDDELGTLNLITEAVRAQAAAEVRTGRWVSLAQPVVPTPIISGPLAPATVDVSPVQQMMSYTGVSTAADLTLIQNHHAKSTHIDALAHWSTDGEVYPGRPRDQVITPGGVTFASTAAFAAGIVTRGVLLDLAADEPVPAGYAVTSRDLEQAEERQGVQVRSGDALAIRFSWHTLPAAGTPTPGISLDAVRWMHHREVSVYTGDWGDAFPPLDPAGPSPLHGVALGRMAMPLIDCSQLDDLASVCAELGRYSFLLVVAPPRVHGLTGSPVNPIALF